MRCSTIPHTCGAGWAWLASAILLALVSCQAASGLEVKVSQNTKKLMPYQVFELTFYHPGEYENPTWDVTIEVQFTSPTGKKLTVGGFFHGSTKPQKPVIRKYRDGRGGTREVAVWPCAPADLWKARYAPSEPGDWKFDYVFSNKNGQSARGAGRFRVVKGRVHQKGWVRVNPKNPLRLIFEDGSPYFPVGFQDGIFDNNHNGSAMDASAMEGPFRPDPEGRRPKPPPGAMFARGPSMNPQNWDVHFGRHSRAGFNLWRFSPNNFSIKLFARDDDPNASTLDNVRWEQAIVIDEMLQMTRKYGIRNFYGIFGYTNVFNFHPEDEQGMAKVKRALKYSVDRWGAYVDFWEFLNEQKASEDWYKVMIPYLRSIDPYHKPISTSWERPEIDGIDINAPHWYGNENELSSDLVTENRAKRDRRFGKPIIYGEQGNYRGKEDRSAEGIGGVWDPGSARRMRVRSWTAFFNEIAFIFWETSYAKDGHVRNIWLGPQERQYIHSLQDFAYSLDPGVKMIKVPLEGSQADEVRSYGLRSERRAAVYLHHRFCGECARASQAGRRVQHNWNHDRGKVKGLKVTVSVPTRAKGYWYDPSDASILGSFDAPAGRRTFTAPPFKVDLALLITDEGPPDGDPALRRGKPNDLDDDDDNDGVPDWKDAFPLEREEWQDVDGDRIGDNLDADTNADGAADDRNKNGTPDNEEADLDGDGVKNANSIPWDAFPRDPKEWRDTDGDGIGDNADTDDDGDGFSDEQEKRAGTNPLSPVSFP
ncbi:DUF5060 domain-containing protein [bacterium]|nr:DUF5060 domain-containing protein [bacterium]